MDRWELLLSDRPTDGGDVFVFFPYGLTMTTFNWSQNIFVSFLLLILWHIITINKFYINMNPQRVDPILATIAACFGVDALEADAACFRALSLFFYRASLFILTREKEKPSLLPCPSILARSCHLMINRSLVIISSLLIWGNMFYHS